jgi:multiple sugar transport system permease protein
LAGTLRAFLRNAHIHVILICGGILLLFPVLWVLFTSLKIPSEIIRVPPTFFPKILNGKSYQAVLFLQQFPRFILNSFIISGGSMIAVLSTSFLGGYAFAKYHFPLKNVIFLLILATAIVPFEVYMATTYLIVVKLRLFDSYLGITLPILIMSFGIFFLKQFAEGIPDELINAARIDGASEFWILIRIAIPLCVSPILALGIFSFTDAWSFFIWPLIVVNSKSMFTVDLGLSAFHRKYYVDHGPIAAGAIISILPMLVIFVILRRRFMEGIALTGIKA